jgi:hypothetical protein
MQSKRIDLIIEEIEKLTLRFFIEVGLAGSTCSGSRNETYRETVILDKDISKVRSKIQI